MAFRTLLPLIGELWNYPEEFKSFFSAGTAWGTFRQERGKESYTAQIELVWGPLTLQTLALPLDMSARIELIVDGKPMEAQLLPDGTLSFPSPLMLLAGQTLSVRFAEG